MKKFLNHKIMFNHKEEIKKALLLSWKYKLLWIFAFFMAETGALLNIGFSEKEKAVVKNVFSASFWQNMGELFSDKGGTFLISLIIVSIVVILLTLIAIVARAAMLSALQRIGKGEDNVFKASLKTGFTKFLLMLLVTIVFVLGNVPGFIFLLLGVLIKIKWLSVALFVIGWLFLAVYNILLLLCKHYIYCFVVFAGYKTKIAIVRGWKMFSQNWKLTVMAQVIRFASVICFSLAIVLVTLILGITFFVLSLLLTGMLGSSAFLIVMSVGIAIDLVLFFIVGMFVRTYLYSYLTELFWYLESK